MRRPWESDDDEEYPGQADEGPEAALQREARRWDAFTAVTVDRLWKSLSVGDGTRSLISYAEQRRWKLPRR